MDESERDDNNAVHLVKVQNMGSMKQVLSGPEDFKPDVVVVFRDRELPNKKARISLSAAEKEKNRDRIIQQLIQSRLYVRTTGSDYDPDDQYVLLGASERRLEQQAELIEYEMPLKPVAPEAAGSRLLEVGGYRKYTRRDRESFVLNSADDDSLFSSLQRQYLIETVIGTEASKGGAGIQIDEEVRAGTVSRFFCLHDQARQAQLMGSWVKSWSRPLPNVATLHSIRNYFGEYVAMYFAFASFYTRWLLYASLIGIAAVVAGVVLNLYAQTYAGLQGLAPTVFSIFLGLWVTFMLNYWKRFNSTLNWLWNMVDWRVSEVTRPAYHGEPQSGLFFENTWVPWPQELTTNYNVPAVESRYFSPGKTKARITGGIVPSTLLALITVLATILILALRLWLQQRIDSTFGSIVGGAVSAVSIKILNIIYRWLAGVLCRLENHRTQEQFDNNYAVKVFMFDFVNSYTSLFYIAFFKRGSLLFFGVQDHCTGPSIPFIAAGQEGAGWGCIDDLSLQIFSMLGTNIAISQATGLILPALKFWWTQKRELAKGKSQIKAMLPAWERENMLEPYEGLGEDMEQMAVQFGYVTMFAAAFPLAPLMALLSNLIEVRSDGYKYLKGTNRSRYRGARGIGVWYEIFNVLGYIAVATNSALVVFTHPALLSLCSGNILMAFAIGVAIEHVLFVLKYVTDVLIPDVPGPIQQQMARVNFIKELLLERATDDDHGVDLKASSSSGRNPLFNSGGNGSDVTLVNLSSQRPAAPQPKTPPTRTPSPSPQQSRQDAATAPGAALPHSVPSAMLTEPGGGVRSSSQLS
eukprot:TRINITY_DN5090_c0_g1_i1.p1 TRINITY_DN5090_c0_g1~~TRINITY_DN5090_c0_g1_i1.p1  ORF type:complete len:807 (+),score=289.96 TRINITY_DN5090_c0_g1_i1:119-2539(+)